MYSDAYRPLINCMLQSASWGSTWSRGVSALGGGVWSRGVSALGGVWSGGMSVQGVWSGGCLLEGGVSQHALRQTPSPPRGQNS